MFLVPSVMKLLGDDCWWAPRWARRLQNKMGLGEIDLPDERKRPTLNGRPARPPVAAASLAAGASRAPHDPTHPGALEPSRATPPDQLEPRPARELAPGAPSAPSAASTTRIQAQPTEAKTARLSVPNAAPAPPPSRPPAPPSSPPTPSSGQTRAMPVPTNHPGAANHDPADPTAALPVMRSDANDSDAATEQLNARGQSDNGDRRRRGAGGGVSAQDLLRREGRL
jgi:trehalose monomycolate/heme transporter